ncbi:MAG: hypothetical protein IKW90_04180 [Lachnospiraceae bacterium]|nr:hypothetical protein [Lachnospiraceae bacterium]
MTNKDILLEVIGDAGERFVPELTGKKKKHSVLKWSALGGVCAAAVIVCVIVLIKMNKNESAISPYVNLPQIGNSNTKSGTDKINPTIRFGEMGFEGLMAYDISELDTPNPWNPDLKLSSLPVYRNLAYNDFGEMVYLSEEQIREIAKNTASALKVDVIDTKITYVKDFEQGEVPDEILKSIYRIDVNCSDNTTITVYGDGQIRIEFERNTLPSGYNFSHNSTSKEEAQKVMDYLSDKYGSLLHYDNALCFSIADRSFSGVENRSYYVYDRSDEPVQSILNYNLSFSKFAPDDNGDLLCIWLNNPLCVSEYLGDYPIISVDEATEQLMNGKYFSSVPGDYIRNGRISKEGIAKIELVYRNNKVEYYQPYYKYYVELDSAAFNMADGLKNYGIFYVPAIDSEFLEEYKYFGEY